MDLKEVLGEELANKVKDKVEDDVLLVKEENHVTKESFNKEREKLKNEKEALQEQLEERDNQLEQLKEDTNATEELKEKIENLKEKNEQTQQELQEKLKQTRLESEIDKKLLKENARNPKAVKALLDMEQVEVDDDGVKGLNDQIENLKENDDYLFEEEGKSNIGKKTNPGGDDGVNITEKDIDSMTEEQINANWDKVSEILSQNK